MGAGFLAEVSREQSPCHFGYGRFQLRDRTRQDEEEKSGKLSLSHSSGRYRRAARLTSHIKQAVIEPAHTRLRLSHWSGSSHSHRLGSRVESKDKNTVWQS
ncbi:hypothetical protein KOW79_015425 [Hemibagrus wyckioides]|uniref:Uncharacterized protein n=1 Tax=Hemibagrus wyckioides TaxID=337641 RepID=A0A9D3NF59_9TELE|nr:hypothetical protein KOW79_015425 [Hemibagrus wyckioides]